MSISEVGCTVIHRLCTLFVVRRRFPHRTGLESRALDAGFGEVDVVSFFAGAASGTGGLKQEMAIGASVARSKGNVGVLWSGNWPRNYLERAPGLFRWAAASHLHIKVLIYPD